MSIYNVLNSGPAWPGNYVQPNTSAPASNASVASYTTGANSLSLTWPVAAYTQPGISAPNAPVSGQLTGGSLGISVAQSNIGSSPASGE
jgi:hypothetical protein